jgi:hypothetical protein
MRSTAETQRTQRKLRRRPANTKKQRTQSLKPFGNGDHLEEASGWQGLSRESLNLILTGLQPGEKGQHVSRTVLTVFDCHFFELPAIKKLKRQTVKRVNDFHPTITPG